MECFPQSWSSRSLSHSKKAPDRPAHPRNDEPNDIHDLASYGSANTLKRDELFLIVYTYASDYYTSRARREPILTHTEAEDLAGETLLEFQRHWKKIRNHEHYVRRMCRNNLFRFLKRKRQREGRESLWTDLGMNEESMVDSSWNTSLPNGRVFESLNDEQMEQLRFSLACIGQADDLTQRLIMYRTGLHPMTYREIEELTGCTEAALRMRYARFRALVQEKYRKCYSETLST